MSLATRASAEPHASQSYVSAWRGNTFGSRELRGCRIVRVSPLELGEDDVLAVLASDASRFPHTVMDQLADLATEESTGVPDQTLTTVGELMDWLLARSR